MIVEKKTTKASSLKNAKIKRGDIQGILNRLNRRSQLVEYRHGC
jgi:hypothetical protein